MQVQRREEEMNRTVRDVMTRRVVTARPTTGFKELAQKMTAEQVSALPVVDEEGRPIGIVSEGDLILKEEFAPGRMRPQLFGRRRDRTARTKAEGLDAAKVMTSPVVCVHPTATLAEAARLMHRRGVKRLPVVGDDGRLMGIVSRADLLKVFLRSDAEIHRDALDAIIAILSAGETGRISFDVRDGVVSLKGQVERSSLIAPLVRVVQRVDGVVGVDSRLSYEVDDLAAQPQVVTPWGVYAPSLRPSNAR
jgi:CBS domain-containing protein